VSEYAQAAAQAASTEQNYAAAKRREAEVKARAAAAAMAAASGAASASASARDASGARVAAAAAAADKRSREARREADAQRHAERFSAAELLLADVAPSSAAVAAAALLVEAEAHGARAAQARSAGAETVAERRMRDAEESLSNAEALARIAAQGAGREMHTLQDLVVEVAEIELAVAEAAYETAAEAEAQAEADAEADAEEVADSLSWEGAAEYMGWRGRCQTAPASTAPPPHEHKPLERRGEQKPLERRPSAPKGTPDTAPTDPRPQLIRNRQFSKEGKSKQPTPKQAPKHVPKSVASPALFVKVHDSDYASASRGWTMQDIRSPTKAEGEDGAFGRPPRPVSPELAADRYDVRRLIDQTPLPPTDGHPFTYTYDSYTYSPLRPETLGSGGGGGSGGAGAGRAVTSPLNAISSFGISPIISPTKVSSQVGADPALERSRMRAHAAREKLEIYEIGEIEVPSGGHSPLRPRRAWSPEPLLLPNDPPFLAERPEKVDDGRWTIEDWKADMRGFSF